jgi:predicted RecB family nuclease
MPSCCAIRLACLFRISEQAQTASWNHPQFILATETNDEQLRTQIMEQILKYNDEDLKATWAVFVWLRGKIPSIPSA